MVMAAFDALSVSSSNLMSIALGNGGLLSLMKFVLLGKRWQQTSYSWSICLIKLRYHMLLYDTKVCPLPSGSGLTVGVGRLRAGRGGDLRSDGEGGTTV